MISAHLVERVVPAIATAGTIVGATIVMLAESVLDPVADVIDRAVALPLLVIVAYFIVRWTRQMLRDIQEIRDKEHKASMDREQLLINQIATLNAQLDAERKMRLSLEQAGLTNRRRDPMPEAEG